jgi:transposase
MIDGSLIRAHQHAAGARQGQDTQALGRSRGGFSTKIHAKVDAFGLPLAFVLTGGEVHDMKKAAELISSYNCEYLIADRGYDSDDLRATLRNAGITPVIPGKKNRVVPVEYDHVIYKERNKVERFFAKIKQFRRIASRFDKTSVMFIGALTLVSILMWLEI